MNIKKETRSTKPNLEQLSFCASELRMEGDTGIFEGYASTFNDVDSYGSKIMPGAFTKTLAERGAKVKILYNHDDDNPIGVPLEMREDSKGLWVRGQLTLGVQKADEAHLLMKSGAFDAMSIGFSVPRGKDKVVDGVREIYEVKLYEFSPVTFPANEQAEIKQVRATNISDTIAEHDLDEGEERIMDALHDTLLDVWWGDSQTIDEYELLLGAAVDDFAMTYKQWLSRYLAQFRQTPEAEAPADGLEELSRPTYGEASRALSQHLSDNNMTPSGLALSSPLTIDDIRKTLKGSIDGDASRFLFAPAVSQAFSRQRRSMVEQVADELRAGLSTAEREQFSALLGLQPSIDTAAKQAAATSEPQQALTDLLADVRKYNNMEK